MQYAASFRRFGSGLLLVAGLPLAAAHAQLVVAGGPLAVGTGAILSVGGSLSVGSAGSLDNQGSIQLTGDLLNAGTIVAGAGVWQLTGTTTQTLAAAGATLASLDVANAAGGTLSQPLTLGTLQLSGGSLRLAASNLVVTATISASSASRFVVTNGAGRLYYPVGTAATLLPIGPADASYRPLRLTRSLGAGQYAVRAAAGALRGGIAGPAYTSHAVALRWDVTPPDDVPYTVAAEWLAPDELSSFNRINSSLARWNGSSYAPAAFRAATGAGPYQQSSAGLTSGGTFIVLDNAAPLPVELVSFEARRLPNQPRVELSWATASESNNVGFEIQRQDEGQTTFQRVGFVAGHGSTTLASQYAFTDPNAFQGPSYYRLRQVDTDGIEAYSPVRVVLGLATGTSLSLSAFPNPARTAFALDAAGPLPLGLTLTLLAADGRVVWQRPQAELAGKVPIDVSTLAEGAYLLRYQAADGARGTVRLVVQH